MYTTEFLHWLDGYSHSVRTRPTVEQWDLIKSMLKSSLPQYVTVNTCNQLSPLKDVA